MNFLKLFQSKITLAAFILSLLVIVGGLYATRPSKFMEECTIYHSQDVCNMYAQD